MLGSSVDTRKPTQSWLHPMARSLVSLATRRARATRQAALLLLGALLVGPAAASATDADLSITFFPVTDPVVGLQQFIFSFKVTNAGPSTATSIKVVNTLPQGVVFDSSGIRDWECTDPVGGVLTCTYLLSLAAGASTIPEGIAVVAPVAGGSLTDSATVSAAETDPVPANNAATQTILVNPLPPHSFYPLRPCRLIDTRDPVNPWGGPALAANGLREFPLLGFCGVPNSARALAVNVTVVGGSDLGDLRISPWKLDVPNASTINFAAGEVRANSAIVPLYQGAMWVWCDMPLGSTGTVHFLLDVSGYFQ